MELHDFKRTLLTNNDGGTLTTRMYDSDIAKTKRTIKKLLINNEDIRLLLDNPDLKDVDDYSEYLFVNIFPHLFVPNTTDTKMNYICFKVDDADDNYFDNVRKENPLIKVVNIQFLVMVHKSNVKTPYGVERHDAIAYVIKKIFGWSKNEFPFRLRCVSDIESVTDNNYASRTLTFECQDENNLTDGRRQNAYGY